MAPGKDTKPRGARRLLRWIFLWLPLWFLLITSAQVLLLRWIPPLTSAFMVSRQFDALLAGDWSFRVLDVAPPDQHDPSRRTLGDPCGIRKTGELRVLGTWWEDGVRPVSLTKPLRELARWLDEEPAARTSEFEGMVKVF